MSAHKEGNSIETDSESYSKREAGELRTEHVGNVPMLDESHPHWTHHPNRWSYIRDFIREPAAEFLGTMIMIMFGTAVDCQVVLGGSTLVTSAAKGDYLSLNFGWACGVALGVWVAGGISGGHLNPSVTLALAVFRGFPWKKVPAYMFAQLMGALCGAGIVYANYIHAIDLYEGGRHIRTVPGTASLFATYAQPYMTPQSAFFDEFLGTAILLIVILAFTDAKNGPPPAGLVPLALFIAVLGIGAAFGMQTGYAINPARDLGPRLLTAMVGYGREVFNFRHQYWIWCPVMAPFLGAQVGTLVYDALLFIGGESIVNTPDASHRRRHLIAHPEQRNKLPAGADAAQSPV